MKKEILPAYFSTLNKGKITLYIRKEYEEKLSKHDMNMFFDLYTNSNELNTVYHGRSSCKSLLMDSLKNEGLVVRDYVHGGLFGKILTDYFWQRLRPLRELSVCEIANKGHILTIEIVAIVMKNIIGPLYKYKLVSKEVTDTIDLMELLLHSDKNTLLAKKRQIISKVAKAVKEMHDVGIYHADLHLKNILVQSGEGGTINVYIIDLDKSRQLEEIDLNKRRKNILRLDRSFEKFNRNASDRKDLLVTKADRIRFLREYIRTGSESRQTLKSYLKTYLTTHKLHRFWWLVVNGR
ncbi:MAG: lipopolysaccharide kinase InaA family protein [Planctomycetota bacterium]|jgi:serine/threonine protein kinase